MRKINTKHYAISFDRFSRQSRAYDVIESLRVKKEKFKILDVGGYRGLTAELHEQDDVTVLDVYDVKEPGYIKGNGLKMPFDDESFDFVVSFDVFEHIPDKDRKKFLQESCRIAKIGVITAAPIRTKANELAEKSLNNLHASLYKKEHEWLKEHIEYGIPRPGQAQGIMEGEGLETITLGSNDTTLWTLMQGAIFLNAKFIEGEKSLEELNVLYNKIAYNDGTADPLESYRHVVCGFKKKGAAKIVHKYVAENSRPIDPVEKVEIAQKITEHYKQTLYGYTELYEKLYSLFEQKVAENDTLIERNRAIEASRVYRVVRKIAKAKNKLAKKK